MPDLRNYNFPGQLLARVLYNRAHSFYKRHVRQAQGGPSARAQAVKAWLIRWEGVILGGTFLGGLLLMGLRVYMQERADDLIKRRERILFYEQSRGMALEQLQVAKASAETWAGLAHLAAARAGAAAARTHSQQHRQQQCQHVAAQWRQRFIAAGGLPSNSQQEHQGSKPGAQTPSMQKATWIASSLELPVGHVHQNSNAAGSSRLTAAVDCCSCSDQVKAGDSTYHQQQHHQQQQHQQQHHHHHQQQQQQQDNTLSGLSYAAGDCPAGVALGSVPDQLPPAARLHARVLGMSTAAAVSSQQASGAAAADNIQCSQDIPQGCQQECLTAAAAHKQWMIGADADASSTVNSMQPSCQQQRQHQQQQQSTAVAEEGSCSSEASTRETSSSILHSAPIIRGQQQQASSSSSVNNSITGTSSSSGSASSSSGGASSSSSDTSWISWWAFDSRLLLRAASVSSKSSDAPQPDTTEAAAYLQGSTDQPCSMSPVSCNLHTASTSSCDVPQGTGATAAGTPTAHGSAAGCGAEGTAGDQQQCSSSNSPQTVEQDAEDSSSGGGGGGDGGRQPSSEPAGGSSGPGAAGQCGGLLCKVHRWRYWQAQQQLQKAEDELALQQAGADTWERVAAEAQQQLDAWKQHIGLHASNVVHHQQQLELWQKLADAPRTSLFAFLFPLGMASSHSAVPAAATPNSSTGSRREQAQQGQVTEAVAGGSCSTGAGGRTQDTGEANCATSSNDGSSISAGTGTLGSSGLTWYVSVGLSLPNWVSDDLYDEQLQAAAVDLLEELLAEGLGAIGDAELV